MKKASLLKQLLGLTGMLMRICDSHHSNLLAISTTYGLLEPESSGNHDPVDTIQIRPCGGLYQLTHMSCHEGVPGTAQWLATYPWNTNGHGLFRSAPLLDPGRGKKKATPRAIRQNHQLILKNL